MAPHSLTRLWRFEKPVDGNQPRPKKAGKPALQWTPSRERKLFRLIAEANVPMKDIAIAMREPAVPAGPDNPGQPKFSPGRSSCRNRWHEMTEMQPHEVLISKILHGKEKHRDRMIAAFKAYQERRSRSDLPSEPQQSIAPNIHKPLPDDPTPVPSIQTIEAADESTPFLTYEGDTPADLGTSVLTPESLDPIQPRISSDDIRRLSVWALSPNAIGPDGVSQAVTKTSTKRRAPSEFDEVTQTHAQKISKQCSPACTEQELSCLNVHECQTPLAIDDAARVGAISGLKSVQEEPNEIDESGRTITDVENDMKVPHGFIHWVKYGLTKSRWSAQSVISATGPMPSQFPPGPSSQDESDSFLYGQTGRPETNLFLELRLAGTPDKHAATRIRQLLEECPPDRARRIVRARNTGQETALEVALALGNVSACEVLLEFGADVKAKTSDGKSLSAFGRAAKKNATTPQQYFAIGTCRNKIRSYTEEGDNRSKPESQKQKGHFNVDARRRAKTRAQIAATHSDVTNTMCDVPQSLDDQSRAGQVGVYNNQLRESGPAVSQESNISHTGAASSQRSSTPGVSGLVNHYNMMSGQHSVQASRMAGGLREPLPNPYDLKPSFNSTGQVPIPEVHGWGPSVGHWEMLPGNRMAFILHSHNDSELLPQVSVVPSGPSSEIPALQGEVSWDMNGLLEFSIPPAQDDFRHSSHTSPKINDTRRHGMILTPVATVLDATISPNQFLFRGPQQPSNIATFAPAFSNAYHNQGYSTHTNALSNEPEPQPPFEDTFEPSSSGENAAFMNVPEAELNEIFSIPDLNNNYVSGWDGIWR
ncbi:hypothetical protein EG329_008468 [Mollisiaceae sp. DMI_Dod_QoI]|nr:hypothetical protein EG329_008468 [Helotiales sp. DMI_Dod_QoI]